MINIKFLLTNKCNFKCRFCHYEFQTNKARANGFDFEKTKTLIDAHLNKFEGQSFSFKFSGGEPTYEMENLLELLNFVQQKYKSKKRILISSLEKLLYEDIKLLMEKGINEIRVNIPSLNPERFHYYTNNSTDITLESILDKMQLFKKLGCNVRVNAVLSELNTKEEVINHMYEMINESKKYQFIDELYFISDYYSDNEKNIYNYATGYLKQIINFCTFRRERIYEGKSDNLMISVSRCLDRINNEKDSTEIYIIPNGKILQEFNFKKRKL